MFLDEQPGASGGRDFRTLLTPTSFEILETCKVEPSVAGSKPGQRFQFERLGYFIVDKDSTKRNLVFNRTVTLRDAWAKISHARK